MEHGTEPAVALPAIPPEPATTPKLPRQELPAIATLRNFDDDASLFAVLDLLFEPSADLHAVAGLAALSMTFDSYDELIDELRRTLLELQAKVHDDAVARAPLLRILGAHPRLGEKKVDSAQSRAEQAKLNEGGDDEGARLAALNREYEERFPGLRYVVFVNGRGRPEIMADMRKRIDRGDLDAEEKEAIQAMCDIAKDRAAKLLRAQKT